MLLPLKYASRKEEITADFMALLEKHIADLLNKRQNKLYHTRDFAAQLFIHPRHLTNTLRLTTGKSPCNFMEERVLAEVQRLLTGTTLSVADVGSTFAYDDPSNFIKFFKGMTGITPLQYRKAAHALI